MQPVGILLLLPCPLHWTSPKLLANHEPRLILSLPHREPPIILPLLCESSLLPRFMKFLLLLNRSTSPHLNTIPPVRDLPTKAPRLMDVPMLQDSYVRKYIEGRGQSKWLKGIAVLIRRITVRSNGVEHGLSRRGHERSHETVNSSHLRTSSVNSHIQLPPGYTIYNRPLDPRLSHFSIDTSHSRNPSQATDTSTFTSPRLSHGPLSLTADRYRGASTPTPPNQAPIRYRRRPNGLSIDTTLSRESYRTGWEPRWQSPILRRTNNSVVTTRRGPSA